MLPIFLRDTLLSFCPAAMRQRTRVYSPSTTLRAATWLGLLQAALFALALAERYRHFFIQRAQQWAEQIHGTSEAVQSGTAVLITLEFLMYPVSLIVLYFFCEGLVRFAAGVTSSEVVPSLPVVLVFKLVQIRERRRHATYLRSLPCDRVESLPDYRIRISSALPKSGWNSSITISIADRWLEVESQQIATGPLPYVYLLRPAPEGKILRRLEQYEPPPLV